MITCINVLATWREYATWSLSLIVLSIWGVISLARRITLLTFARIIQEYSLSMNNQYGVSFTRFGYDGLPNSQQVWRSENEQLEQNWTRWKVFIPVSLATPRDVLMQGALSQWSWVGNVHKIERSLKRDECLPSIMPVSGVLKCYYYFFSAVSVGRVQRANASERNPLVRQMHLLLESRRWRNENWPTRPQIAFKYLSNRLCRLSSSIYLEEIVFQSQSVIFILTEETDRSTEVGISFHDSHVMMNR